MQEWFKKHRFGSSIMALIFVITAFTSCTNDVYMEFSETAKNEEYDEVGVREPNVGNDAEDLSVMEIYESVLNGGLTVERKGQQVRISELFWNNDIQYCFFDIDDDGSEELHIRDDVIYYVIKVQEETPQVIFEGWWSYTPVVTDKLCGILDYRRGYGSEQMEFIKISADGSVESEGMFYWFDNNKNGRIDEEDSFSGSGNIGMEQYVQYKEKYTVMQAGNELEWMDGQFRDFATWQEAYIDFIKKIHVTVPTLTNGFQYSLIYVDADDIPELYIYTGGMATGEIIVSFYDGKIGTMNRDRIGIQYMEHGGLLYNANGAMGFYPCNIYMLEKGEFSEIGTGWYSEYGDEQGNLYADYYWEDSLVTETEYHAHIDKLIDASKCMEPSLLYSEDEILEILID